tara:strand:- start:63 stop:215 length:153 start_codon:yes stop_codon:yes gene_type:complete
MNTMTEKTKNALMDRKLLVLKSLVVFILFFILVLVLKKDRGEGLEWNEKE